MGRRGVLFPFTAVDPVCIGGMPPGKEDVFMRKGRRQGLSLLLVLVMLLGLLPGTAWAAGTEGSMVLSVEMYLPEEQTVVLLKGPEKLSFTQEDTGLSLLQRVLGAENVGGTSFISSLTIDGIVYGGEEDMSGQSGYYWGLYRNNSPDSEYIDAYRPADGDVYRVIFTAPDFTSPHMYPIMPHDLDGLYWAMAETEDAEMLEEANALVQSGSTDQTAIDELTQRLSQDGESHYVLVDDRSVQVIGSTYPYTYITTLKVEQNTAAPGEEVQVTVMVPEGMALKEGFPKANGQTLNQKEGELYTFSMPDSHVTVTAEFVKLDTQGDQLLSAQFSLDEAGEQIVPLTPAFDPEVTKYTLTVTDAQLPENTSELYSLVTFPQGASAQMYYMMSYEDMEFATPGPELTSGEPCGHKVANLFAFGNGLGHYIMVTPEQGGTKTYVFTMTRLLSLTGLTVTGNGETMSLSEDFSPTSLEQTVIVPAELETVEIAPEVFNEDNYVYVNGTLYEGTPISVPVPENGESIAIVVADDELEYAENQTEYHLTVETKTKDQYAQMILDRMAAALAESGTADLSSNVAWYTADMMAYWKLFPETEYHLSEDQIQAMVDKAIAAIDATTFPSEMAQYIIALSAMGYDASQLTTALGETLNGVGKLVEAVEQTDISDTNFGSVYNIYTLPYVLIALEQFGTDYQEIIDRLVASALSQESAWLEWRPDGATPMLLALSPFYSSNSQVREVLDRTVEAIAAGQEASGATGNAASTGLTVAGMAALGKNPCEIRHSETGNSLVDGLVSLANDSMDGFEGDFSNEQGMRGLIAIAGAKSGESYRLYDFSNGEKKPAVSTVGAENCLVKFAVVPGAAQIQVHQGENLVTPVRSGSYDLAAGEYTYTVSCDGYATKTGSFIVTDQEAAENQLKTVYVSLTSEGGQGGGESTKYINVTLKVMVPPTDTDRMYIYKNDRALYTDLLELSMPMKVESGSTVRDVLIQALDQQGVKYKEVSGGYFSSIGGWEEQGRFSTSGWMYMVGSQVPQQSSAQYVLTSSKEITWFYTDDYSKDYGSESWNGGTQTGTGAEIKEQADGSYQVTLPKDSTGSVLVTIPKVSEGDLLVIVHADGTQEVVKKSVVQDGTAYLMLDENATVKVVDYVSDFNDVKEDAWYADAVDFTAGRGLFSGVGGGSFAPDETLNRGMVVTVLYALEDVGAQKTAGLFDDVAEDAWYAQGTAWAVEAGIVSGYGDGQFGPNDAITREQLALMLYRYAQYMKLSTGTGASLEAFGDEEEISSWAQQAMSWAVSAGILGGTPEGNLNPGGTATRAEAAVMVSQFVAWMLKSV